MVVSTVTQRIDNALENNTPTEFFYPYMSENARTDIIKYNLNPQNHHIASYQIESVPNEFLKKSRAVFQFSWDQKKLYNAPFFKSAALTTTLFMIALLGIRYLPQKYRNFLETEQKRCAELAKGKIIITSRGRRAATATDYMPNYRPLVIFGVFFYSLALLRCAYQTKYHLYRHALRKHSISFTERSIDLNKLSASIKKELRKEAYQNNPDLVANTCAIFQINKQIFSSCWENFCKATYNEKENLAKKYYQAAEKQFSSEIEQKLSAIDEVYKKAATLEEIPNWIYKYINDLLKKLNSIDSITHLTNHAYKKILETKEYEDTNDWDALVAMFNPENPQEYIAEQKKKEEERFNELKKIKLNLPAVDLYQFYNIDKRECLSYRPWKDRVISEFEHSIIPEYFYAFPIPLHYIKTVRYHTIRSSDSLSLTFEYKKESPWLYLAYLKKLLMFAQHEPQEEKTDWVIDKLNELIKIIEPMVTADINAAKEQAKNNYIHQFAQETTEFKAAVLDLEYQKRLQNFTELVPEAKDFLS